MTSHNSPETLGTNPPTDGITGPSVTAATYRMLWAVAASLLLHLGLLLWDAGSRAAWQRLTPGTHMGQRPTGPLRVRLAAQDRPQTPTPADSIVSLTDEAKSGTDAGKGRTATSLRGQVLDRRATGSEQLAGLALPKYHDATRLTKQPQLISELSDLVPATLPPGFHGKVRLVLLLNERGETDSVVVEESALSSELTLVVVETFKAARFSPGEIDGTPVKCAYSVLVDLAATDE